jgi:hypothetical protein
MHASVSQARYVWAIRMVCVQAINVPNDNNCWYLFSGNVARCHTKSLTICLKCSRSNMHIKWLMVLRVLV